MRFDPKYLYIILYNIFFITTKYIKENKDQNMKYDDRIVLFQYLMF